jgi:benzoate/toluate 1,2-dioxygenase alpha subunit
MRGFWRHWVGAVGRDGELLVIGDRPAEFLEGRELR